jgi:glycosyltransferase involved in cell wall biosynthesis
MIPSIYFWVISPNEYNSLYIQVKLQAEMFYEFYKVRPVILHPNVENVKKKLHDIQKSNDLLFWHYGSFDKFLIGLDTSKINFVYHNITPARFFWKNDFLVALKSCVGQLQLRTLSKSSRWITVSDFNKTQLNKLGFKDVQLLPNVIQKEELVAQKTEVFSLLYVGRISPNKNCLKLLEAIKKLCGSTNETVLFTIVGNGKQNCNFFKKFLNEIDKMREIKNLKLRWEKNLELRDLSILYQQSWLYVSMSKHEGFGVPACESIMYGTPALYLASGGQESVLSNHGLVSLDDEDNFDKKILELMTNDIARQTLLNDQAAIVQNYKIPNVLTNVKDVFDTYL